MSDPTPSKEELRKKYHISASDFAVLTAAKEPAPEDLRREGAFLEKAGWYGRFEVWLKKSLIGNVVLAVILIGGFIGGIEKINEYGHIVYANRKEVANYVSNAADFTKDTATTFLISLAPNPSDEDLAKAQEFKNWSINNTGSQMYPISGSYRV